VRKCAEFYLKTAEGVDNDASKAVVIKDYMTVVTGDSKTIKGLFGPGARLTIGLA
jgi:hypothetical protein